MTREEKEKLIRHLKYNLEIGADYLITDKDVVGIIEALEQEPCEDAISRQMVADYLCAHCPDDAECFNDCDDIKNIKDFPPVQPVQKTGHWIRKENEFFTPSRFNPIKETISTCSICGSRYIGIHEDFKYCPNCGAKMVEPQKSEE